MSIYQKRWSSCGKGVSPSLTSTTDRTRTTPTASNVITSGIEPSTIGTSWNSVRWNKPSTSYRASLASRFENNNTSTTSPASTYTPQKTSRFLSSSSTAAKNAADVASIGPSVSVRASRFDSANIANKEKYRSEARDLISKWSSRERNSINNTFRSPVARSTFRSTDSLATPSGVASTSTPKAYSNTAYRTSTSLTPTRPILTASSPSASRYSIERKSVLSPSPTPIMHTTPKADRPWRQRMAESSRIRSTLGDDVGEGYTSRRNASSRRNSLSQDEGAYETAVSSSAYPSRVPSYSSLVPTSSYRSRQSSADSSSVFTPSTRFTTSSTPYSLRNTIEETNRILSKYADRSASRSKSPTRDNLPTPAAKRATSQAPKNPSIRESSKERDAEKTRKKSIRERTARRNSRQNSQQDSSSDEEINRVMRSRSNSRKRKNRKKEGVLSPTTIKPAETFGAKSMNSSLYETGPEEILINSISSQLSASLVESIQALTAAAENEGFHSCAASPLAPSISRSSSKNGVIKNQVIKCPSLVEVHGLPRSESKSSVKPSDSKDDESQYSAIVHFKPMNKIKRLAPVPGLWKTGAENEEFISRNKRFVKEDDSEEVEINISQRVSLKVEKKLKVETKKPKVLVKKKVVAVKKPEDPKSPKLETQKPATPKPDPKEVQKPATPKVEVKASEVQKPAAAKPVSKPAETQDSKPAAGSKAEVPKPDTPKSEVKTSENGSKPATPKPVSKPAEVLKLENGSKSDVQKLATPGSKASETPKLANGSKTEAAPAKTEVKTPEVQKPATPKAVAVQKPTTPAQDPKSTVQKSAAPAKPEAKTSDVQKPVTPSGSKTAAVQKSAAPAKPEVKTPEVQKPATPPGSKSAGVQDPKANAISKNSEIPKSEDPKIPTELPSQNGVEKKKLVLTRKKKKVPEDEEVKQPDIVATSDKKIEITKSLSKKPSVGLKIEKVLKIGKNLDKTALKCKKAGNVSINWSEFYRRRDVSEKATVLVDTPIKDFNHSVIKFSTKVAPVIKTELPLSRSVSCASETRASVILDEMRGTEAAVEWTRDSDDEVTDNQTEMLILPDESILEKYVNRKRARHDRLRGVRRPNSMCSARGYESSDCASPCPSTVSELCLPSSVRIHEPQDPPNYDSDFSSFNSIPKGFSRVQAPPPVVKPVPFEAPKTLFERMIQDQANKNRQHPVLTDSLRSDSETRDPSPRRGSEEGMSSISQQFAAAAAANNGHGQVRYAAHIPVNRSNTIESGRISTSSMDSQKSGALDVASKNIDQVIDQARHRHHQHRNKFKEAIDYLDQIFEDLKKECDTTDDKNNNDGQKTTATIGKKDSTTSVVNRRKSVDKPKQSATAETTETKPKNSRISVVKPKPTSTTTSQVAEKKQQTQSQKSKPQLQQQTQSPVEVVIPVRKLSTQDVELNEPTVAETIVLAKKTDKMDFTRRWLQDDLSSLAHLPPANIAPNVSYYQDFDEHSLGSCSAEVAAFNTVKERKNSSKSARKPTEGSDPVRPRPFRPQPIYPTTDAMNSSAFENYTSSNTLPRVTSTDEMRRSGSQDPYSTLRSMRSEGGGEDRPSPSAFQQVSAFSRGGSMRSSLRSLPDHSPARQRSQKPDPIMSIDQLVAELELNTDHQPTSAIEKRRSFPTSFARPQYIQPQNPSQHEYEKPTRYRAEIKQAPARTRVQGYPAQRRVGGGQPTSVAPPLSNTSGQKSLDEVTNMLNKVVSQFGSKAFETINQEKINPSRVEAMHNMFEKGTTSTAWKINQPTQQPYRHRDDDALSKMSPVQEAQYASLNNYNNNMNMNNNNINNNGSSHHTNHSKSHHMSRNSSQPSHLDYIPQLPTSQPPQRPPGSANSSTGGYYSSNSSGIGGGSSQHQQYNARRSLVDQQSISSRVPSVDDDDDGFYDNIGIFDDRRFSRGSELDGGGGGSNYRNLPPSSSSSSNTGSGHKHNRIGSFLRKIGGGGNRPPGSAASLMSLNKIANETVMKPVGLMKSNSLSTEPWKKQVLQSSMPREASNHKTGIGARLKNSLFGSKKRLDG